jgi:hypothetical protein
MKNYVELFEEFGQEQSNELWARLYHDTMSIYGVNRTLEDAYAEQRFAYLVMGDDEYPEPGSPEDDVDYVRVDPSDSGQASMLTAYCRNTYGAQIIECQDPRVVLKILILYGVDALAWPDEEDGGFNDVEDLEAFLGEKFPLKEDRSWADSYLDNRIRKIKRRLGMRGMFVKE